MMALDGKTIIKEEITDKDAYEAATASNNSSSGGSRRNKANPSSASTTSAVGKDCSSNTTSSSSNGSNGSSSINSERTNSSSRNTCRTPDSPQESTRAIAPRSPMSPQLHHSNLAPPPRPNRNASASPIVNGATTTPPPASAQSAAATTAAQQQAAVAAAAAAAAHVEQARLLGKIRKFLGSLVQLVQEVHPEVSERVRVLVLSLASAGISIDEFRLALQEVINLPLRPYVIPLLKNHITLLQREIAALARATNQTTLQYVTTNENSVMEFAQHGPPSEYSDIFMQLDGAAQAPGNGVATSLVFKRRSSDNMMDHHNGVAAQDWNDYMSAYPAKRLHAHSSAHASSEGRVAYNAQPTLFDYSSSGVATQSEASSFGGLLEKASHRDERDLRAAAESQRHISRVGLPSSSGAGIAVSAGATNSSAAAAAAAVAGGGGGMGGEEEWKNIHTMLNCISAMVDKTKRAITILQQRGVEPQPQPNYGDISPAALVEIRRQTEEKVAEFKRNAEEAVNQVKRQAVIEIQRAVVAAETRAAEVMAQERLRMEKFFVEMSRHSGAEREMDNKSPSITATQNSCWNCGRKATETCSGCNLARYCGAFCQHKDWEHHHQICGTTRTTDLSNKHSAAVAAAAAAAQQVIPLTANMRGALVRSPPNSAQAVSQSQSSAQQSQGSNSGTASSVVQSSSLVPNGLGSK